MAQVETSLNPAEQLRKLHATLLSQDGFEQVIAALHSGQPATVEGAWGSSCALVARALSDQAPSCLVVVCAKANAVDDFCDDL